METKMTRFAVVLAATLALAAPVAADSLGTLLPTLTFPEPPVTISTSGCSAEPVCTLAE